MSSTSISHGSCPTVYGTLVKNKSRLCRGSDICEWTSRLKRKLTVSRKGAFCLRHAEPSRTIAEVVLIRRRARPPRRFHRMTGGAGPVGGGGVCTNVYPIGGTPTCPNCGWAPQLPN